MPKKTHGAAKVNRKRRSPTLRPDAGPPPPRLPAFKPRALRGLSVPEAPPPDMEAQIEGMVSRLVDRHLRRLIEGVLVEVRATRQYTMWIHEMLANQEIGKELPSPKGLRDKARSNGRNTVGNRELTEEEQHRIASGEDVEDVLGI